MPYRHHCLYAITSGRRILQMRLKFGVLKGPKNENSQDAKIKLQSADSLSR